MTSHFRAIAHGVSGFRMFAQVLVATEQFLFSGGFIFFLRLFYVSLDPRHLPPLSGFAIASERESGQDHPKPSGKVIISNSPPAHSNEQQHRHERLTKGQNSPSPKYWER